MSKRYEGMLKHSWEAEVSYLLDNGAWFDTTISGDMWAASFDDVETIVCDDYSGDKGRISKMTIVQEQKEGEWTRVVDFTKPGPRVTTPSKAMVKAWQGNKAPCTYKAGQQEVLKLPAASKKEKKGADIDVGARAHKRKGKQNRKKREAYPADHSGWFGECEGVEMLHIDDHSDDGELKPFKPRIRAKA